MTGIQSSRLKTYSDHLWARVISQQLFSIFLVPHKNLWIGDTTPPSALQPTELKRDFGAVALLLLGNELLSNLVAGKKTDLGYDSAGRLLRRAG